MPAQAAIYIQEKDINLYDVFPDAKSDKSIIRKNPSYYDVNLNGDIVRFNVMESNKIQEHINGFIRYIQSLSDEKERKDDTVYAISHIKHVLGLVTNKDFNENQAIWQSLFKIADKYNGFVFVHDSVLTADGVVMVGPMRKWNK
jgi:hypothetical protein